jgi:hypothetical protein
LKTPRGGGRAIEDCRRKRQGRHDGSIAASAQLIAHRRTPQRLSATPALDAPLLSERDFRGFSERNAAKGSLSLRAEHQRSAEVSDSEAASAEGATRLRSSPAFRVAAAIVAGGATLGAACGLVDHDQTLFGSFC